DETAIVVCQHVAYGVQVDIAALTVTVVGRAVDNAGGQAIVVHGRHVALTGPDCTSLMDPKNCAGWRARAVMRQRASRPASPAASVLHRLAVQAAARRSCFTRWHWCVRKPPRAS